MDNDLPEELRAELEAEEQAENEQNDEGADSSPGPDQNVAEANELEVNEHNTVTGTAPTGNIGPDAVEDVDHELYAATRSLNSNQVSQTFVRKYTVRRIDWDSVNADETFAADQHNANVTAARNAALAAGLMPVWDSGSFVGTEDMDEDSLALVYEIDVVPNNDDAAQIYVNPRDMEKAADLTNPGWAPVTVPNPDEQEVNNPDATWTQPEPVHFTDQQPEASER